MQAEVFSRFRKEDIQNTKIITFWVVKPDHSELTSKERLGTKLQHTSMQGLALHTLIKTGSNQNMQIFS